MISQQNYEGVFNILKEYEIVNHSRLMVIQKSFEKIQSMAIFSNKDYFNKAKSNKNQLSNKEKELTKKIKEQNVNNMHFMYIIFQFKGEFARYVLHY